MFLYVGLLMGLMAFIGALGFHEVMIFAGATMSDSLVLALFVFPMLWAAIAAYFLIGGAKLKKSIYLTAVPLFGTVLLMVGN